MTSNEKKLKELGAILDKNNSLRISQAIRILRDEPPFPGALALLISHYDRSTSITVRQLISGFMNDMKDTIENLEFQMPWMELAIVAGVAWVASMLMTIIPAWQASKIYPAEALRYE